MTTQPHSARQLLRAIAGIFANPATHGHPDIPPLGRFQIDFDGYKGVSDFIGGDLFTAATLETRPVESDLAEKFLSIPANHPDGRKITLGEILDEAIEAHLRHRQPNWNDEEGAHGHLDIRFIPRLRITGKITRRFLSSRTSRV
jgi:hypothetical protein